MAYFILGAAVLIGLFLGLGALRRLTARGVRLAGLAAISAIAAAAVLIFIISGRYGLAAPAGAVALWVMRAYLLARQIKAGTQSAQPPAASGKMSRAEALDILGLEEGASEKQIEEAYKALILKNHPDQGGTDWLAARLNEARATLLE